MGAATRSPQTFRFRPRFGALAVLAVVAGVVVCALGWQSAGATLAVTIGGLGVILGASYLLSPAWRIVVVVDDESVEVQSKGDRKFRLTRADVADFRFDPEARTCFLSGGTPETSLLVPGPGAPAPYTIENKDVLYAALVAWVPADKQRPFDLAPEQLPPTKE